MCLSWVLLSGNEPGHRDILEVLAFLWPGCVQLHLSWLVGLPGKPFVFGFGLLAHFVLEQLEVLSYKQFGVPGLGFQYLVRVVRSGMCRLG